MAADSNQQKSRGSPFWAAACLLLIIVGIILFFTSHNNHPLMLAYRAGLVGLGVVGLIIVAITSRARGTGADPRQLAHTILAQQKSLYSAPHEYAPANPDEFPDLDMDFYASAQTALESQGFRLLDDVENMTLSQALPALHTFTRTMAGDDEKIVARIAQIRPSGRFGRQIASVEFCTEFNDFTFLCTTNAEVSLDAVDTRGIVTVRHPPNTSVLDLLRHHREAVQSALARNPSLQPVRCGTLDSALASLRRAHAVRAVHRKRNGYVTEDDMKLIRGEPLTELDRDIFEQINQLEAEERTAHADESADNQDET